MVLDQLIHSRQFTYELLQIQNFHNSDTVQMLYSIYYPEQSQFKTRNLCRWHSTAKIMSGQAKFAECKENQLEFNVNSVSIQTIKHFKTHTWAFSRVSLDTLLYMSSNSFKSRSRSCDFLHDMNTEKNK